MSPQLSIVVPLFEENSNILKLVEEVANVFLTQFIECILVDDGSSDDTWEYILEAQHLHPCVRAIRLIQHEGQSAALWVGLNAARAEIIATMDGDLQNDPADLPRMLEELCDCDLVCGIRARRKDHALRRVSSRLANQLLRLTCGFSFHDVGCGIRIFRRSVLPTLIPFNGIHRFIPIFAAIHCLKVREVSVNHRPRSIGKSKYGLLNRLSKTMADLLVMRWYCSRCFKNLQCLDETVQSTITSAGAIEHRSGLSKIRVKRLENDDSSERGIGMGAARKF